MEFKISDNFIDKYKRRKAPFGFNGLGELVYQRTYSRIKDNGKNEKWWETVKRVVEGTYNIQKEWIEGHRLEWNPQKAQYSAQQMYDRIWSMKLLPPGRGLFAQGTDIIHKKKLTPALYNCNAISTQDIKKDPSYPFKFTMDMLMCFAGDTMVNTANGPKRIDSLNGLPYVAMVNDKPYLAPRGSWITGKKEVFKIDTYDGYSITLTDNHPIQDSGGEWVEVKDLKEGTLLSLNTTNTPLNWTGTGNYKEGYLIGAFWGDGYQCSHNQIVSVNEKDAGYKGIQEEVLSCSTILSLRKDSSRSWKKRSDRDEHIFNIGNSLASKYSFKKGSPKRLGPSIVEGSYDFYIGFLKGAFDSDGHVTSLKNKSHIVGLTQANHEDLKVVQDMLLRLGIASKINVKRKAQGLVTFSNGRVGDIKACWTLVISKDNVIKYNKLIGFSHTAKKEKLQNMVDDHTFNKESFTTKVKSIESKGIQTVWDTSVDDLHALDANGFIAHNCGVGVGGDTRGAGTVEVQTQPEATLDYIIPDSREGWVSSLGILIDSFFGKGKTPIFDYSEIRAEGEPIKTFGGKSSGPEPLRQLHEDVTAILNKNIGSLLSERVIVDIFNLTGKTVVAGNVRRSAILMAGSNSDEFLDLKDYKKHPDRIGHGWASNNSVLAELGMDYSEIAERICINGEPGLIWLENAHNNKRMGDTSNGMQKDDRTIGTNPCLVGDTLVAVADGRKSVSIKELCDKGDDVPVYCLDSNGTTKIRYMRHPRLTGSNVAVYKVLLDDGNIVRATLNHKVRLKNGEYKEIKDLEYGDSLHIMSKFNAPINDIISKSDSKLQDYTWINNGLKTSLSEHRLIAEFANNCKIPTGHVVHHIDYLATNNNPDNLVIMSKKDHDTLHSVDMLGDKNPMRRAKHEWSDEKWKTYKSNMSIATTGDKNGRYSGITNQELKEHALTLTSNLQQRFSAQDWVAYAKKIGIPQHFSKWRKHQLGGLTALAKWAALELGFDTFVNQDPRSIKAYKKYTSEGYNCTFINNHVKIIKECEGCSTELILSCTAREQSICQKCSTKKLNSGYTEKRHANQKASFLKMKEAMQEKQVKAFVDLKFSTGKVPTKKEWIKHCKTIDLSFEISRKGSPFRSWNDLKESASTYNHKVVSVELDGYEDVYNGTVDEFHNFFIGDFETQTSSGKAKSLFLNNLNCGEIVLESGELCNLVEVFPDKHDSKEDFIQSLKYAYLYSKTITLLDTHWPDTNRVMLRNRRVGTSVSGVAQFLSKNSLKILRDWLNDGYDALKSYDKLYSDWFAIPRSIRLSTNKPSGSISLLNGSTPGIHFPESRFYIRRMRLASNSDLVKPLEKAGYTLEPAVGQEESTVVVEIPVDVGEGIRTAKELTMWEQLELAAFMGEHWADNAVSVTITFDPETEGKDIEKALDFYQYRLKSVSFLPRLEHGAYPQMPYEAIDEDTYTNMLSGLGKLSFSNIKGEEADIEKFCNNDSCEIL